jgi:hypothetical protein
VCCGATSKDIQDERGAVDDHHIERFLQVPLLARCEVTVNHDQVVTEFLSPVLDLLQLPRPDVGSGHRVRETLGD